MREIDFMEVGGFQAGHAQNFEAGTGCTVFLFDGCAPAGVDIRGGGPASPLPASALARRGLWYYNKSNSGGSPSALRTPPGPARAILR